jgi:hypothetical protein
LSRFDKYDGMVGGFRAPLNAAYGLTGTPPVNDPTVLGKVRAVSLNASGRVVLGTAGQSGFVGVICLNEGHAAGDVVDVMTSGEIVEFLLENGSAAAAGTVFTSNADGTYGTTAVGVANFKIGWTVQAGRLVVRVGA